MSPTCPSGELRNKIYAYCYEDTSSNSDVKEEFEEFEGLAEGIYLQPNANAKTTIRKPLLNAIRAHHVPAYLETFLPEDYTPGFAPPIPGITVLIPLITKTFNDMSRLIKMARVAEVLDVRFESPFHFQLVMDCMDSLFGYGHFDGLMGNFKYFFPEDKPPADRKGRPIPRISRVLVRIGSPYRNHEGGIGTALEEQMLYHMDVSPEIWLEFEEEHSKAWMNGLNATFRCGNRSKQIYWSELDGGEECKIGFAKDLARRLGLHKIDRTCWLHFGVDSPSRTAFRRWRRLRL